MRQWHVVTQLFPIVSRPNFSASPPISWNQWISIETFPRCQKRITPLVSASNHDQPWQMESEASTLWIPMSQGASAASNASSMMSSVLLEPLNLKPCLSRAKAVSHVPSWPRETCWSNKWVAVIHRHRSCHCGPHQSDQSQPSQEKDWY